MKDVLTYGETMVVFTSDMRLPLKYARNFQQRIAGAESNTAIGLSKLGCSVSWVSRVGEDPFGEFLVNQIRAEGVDVEHIIYDNDKKTGLMFKEPRGQETNVYYYRDDSAASNMKIGDVDEKLVAEHKILHVTGITPALSDSCLELTQKLYEIAKQQKRLVSFDPNIRKKIWKNKNLKPIIREFALDSDIVLLGRNEAEILFDTNDSQRIFDTIFEKGRASYIGLKDGANGSSVATKDQILKFEPEKCDFVDSVGAGDAYNTGFLYGILNNQPLETIGKYANIIGAMVTETIGDIEGYPSKKMLNARVTKTQEVYR